MRVGAGFALFGALVGVFFGVLFALVAVVVADPRAVLLQAW